MLCCLPVHKVQGFVQKSNHEKCGGSYRTCSYYYFMGITGIVNLFF